MYFRSHPSKWWVACREMPYVWSREMFSFQVLANHPGTEVRRGRATGRVQVDHVGDHAAGRAGEAGVHGLAAELGERVDIGALVAAAGAGARAPGPPEPLFQPEPKTFSQTSVFSPNCAWICPST
jgi:hypothetical protein